MLSLGVFHAFVAEAEVAGALYVFWKVSENLCWCSSWGIRETLICAFPIDVVPVDVVL